MTRSRSAGPVLTSCLRRLHIVLFVALLGLCQACLAQSQAQREGIEDEMNAAIQKVQNIVNQPVTMLLRTQDMQVATYSPGWFHEGADKPNFDIVDVRKTRQTPYAQHQYVTSNLNPGIVFLGSELEFNPMTKYFYTDRSTPKKKLSEEEMLEINQLYRVIGRCERQLAEMGAR